MTFVDDPSQGLPGELRFTALYPELRRLARRERYRFGRPLDHQTTSLVHEAWLKLNAHDGWADRAHFLCAAAQAMRHILISAARARLRMKRSPAGGLTLFTERAAAVGEMPDETLVELNKAIDRLAGIDARLASVVECRYFAGYTDSETAEALKVNERTVRRDWLKAKAWLFRELTD